MLMWTILGSLDQRPGVADRLVEGEPAARETDPVGVIEYIRPFEVFSHLCDIAEVKGGDAYLMSEGVGSIGVRSEGLDPHSHRKQPAGNVFARITERTGDDAQVGG